MLWLFHINCEQNFAVYNYYITFLFSGTKDQQVKNQKLKTGLNVCVSIPSSVAKVWSSKIEFKRCRIRYIIIIIIIIILCMLMSLVSVDVATLCACFILLIYNCNRYLVDLYVLTQTVASKVSK